MPTDLNDSGIYLLKWGTDISYVGQSITISLRVASHFRKMVRGAHPNKLIQNYYDSYGYPDVVILAKNISSDRLDAAERYYIDYIGNGLHTRLCNLTCGNGPLGSWYPRTSDDFGYVGSKTTGSYKDPLWVRLLFNRWAFAILVVALYLALGGT